MATKKEITPKELAEKLARKRRIDGATIAKLFLLATISDRLDDPLPEAVLVKANDKFLKMTENDRVLYRAFRLANLAADANRMAHARALHEGLTACELVKREDEIIFMATTGKADWPLYNLKVTATWPNYEHKTANVSALDKTTDHFQNCQALLYELEHRKVAMQIAGDVFGLPKMEAFLEDTTNLIDQVKERNAAAQDMLEYLFETELDENVLAIAKEHYSPIKTEYLAPDEKIIKQVRKQLNLPNFDALFYYVPAMLNVNRDWDPSRYEDVE